MFSIPQAWQTIVSQARPLETVRIPLAKSLGHVLRVDAKADFDSPPFDASAMDGYAMRRDSAVKPVRVVGESQAGRPFTGRIGQGECIRIFTGAPVPADCDCVIKQEDIERENDLIRVKQSDSQNFIRRRGENRRAGDIVVPAGTRSFRR